MPHTQMRRSILLRGIAIIASGLMMAALVPPFSYATLAWLCLIPLLISLWTLQGKHRAKRGFLIGYATGAICFGVQVSWLATVSWLGPIVLAGYLALYLGAFGAFAATIGNPWHQKKGTAETPLRSLFTAFTHASIFAGLEWLRGWMLTGFGWNGLGVAFHDSFVISQAADILGVAGLTLMLVFFQCVLVQAGHRILKTGKDGIRRPRWDFGVAALGIGILLAYGILRISIENGKDSIDLKALLIQVNIPQDAGHVLWTAEEVHMAYEEDTISALNTLARHDKKALENAMKDDSAELNLKMPDWVLWPETSLTGRLIRDAAGNWAAWRQNTDTIARVREAGEFSLIYGLVEIEGEIRDGELFQKENPRFYNSIAIQDPNDNLQIFQKRHLVIFGETIPFVDSVPWLRQIYEWQAGTQYTGAFTPGPSLDPLPKKLHGTQVGIIPSVCFEDTVPRLTRKFVRNEPQIIVNLTNDGWFKTSPAADQHFANARFRAIELRRPMLRCANTGVSAAIDTLGSTIHPETGTTQEIRDANGSPFVRDHLLASVKIPKEPSTSPYILIGDWGIILLSILGTALAFGLRHNH